MITKWIAGVLILLLGFVLLWGILLINSGHTSADFSLSDDLLGVLLAIALTIGGGYALFSGDKSRFRK